ncbi:G protein beta subunit-like protein [Pseudoloma neurophilia]|uniref:G protein beta subunit-like protein n=1 Tax=Pseudoloma neurophilia TaxID=146866 RepID=A0A0R0LX78_9MICR|nr:G protein beta subunit-like protein [Pseudoloma neurophilia]
MATASLVPRNKQKVHKEMITSLDVPYTGNSDFLYSSSRDKKIFQWKLSGNEQDKIGHLLKEFKGQSHHICGVKSNKTNEKIVSVSADKTGRIYDLKTGEFVTLKSQKSDLTGIAINTDDNKIITSSYDGTIALWNTKGELSKTLAVENPTNFPIMVLCCAFVPNSNLAVTGSSDGKLRIWDIDEGKVIRTFLNGHKIEYYAENELPLPEASMITAVTISADGSFLAYGGRDSKCYVIRLNEDIQLLSFETETPICSIAFSITETIIAVSTKTSIICWNIVDDEMVLQLENEEPKVNCTSLIWSKNALVTGWLNGEIKVFDFVRSASKE